MTTTTEPRTTTKRSLRRLCAMGAATSSWALGLARVKWPLLAVASRCR